ncbi:MAG: nicotinamide riboside transporter PnuC [Bacteroidales bacterium]|nr:nicotinamide riboside transporter PnuC [Bacteroidales bacterium]
MAFLELAGTIVGLVYLFLEYKANVWLWPAGILMSLLYVVVFFHGKFYADAGVYLYYIGANTYGLIAWLKGRQSDNGQTEELPIIHTPKSKIPMLTVAFVVVYAIIAFVLVRFTDSPVPYGDAFTTSLSIVAMYMLAKKYLEQWLLWIVINVVSTALYLWKGLYPTAILFTVYIIVAIMGYFKWRRDMLKLQNH